MDDNIDLIDPRLLAARDAHVRRLEGLFAGRTPENAFVLCGMGGWGSADVLKEPETWALQAAEALRGQARKAIDENIFRPLVLENWIYGVHFIDHLLGGRVHFTENQWWCDFLDRPVGTLEPADLEANTAWRRARELATACVEKGQGAYVASQVLSSPLNIIVNLYGQAVLEAMLLDEEAVRRDLRVVNDTILALHRWYRAHVPVDRFQPVCAGGRFQPAGHGQLCGCTTHLLSAGAYSELIAPLDDEVLSLYPGGGLIHLCGDHTRHIAAWRAMRSMRAVQVNDRAAEDLEIYFKELRDDQVIYLNPTATMTVERAMAITGGRRLVIVGEVGAPLATRG